MRLSHTLLFSVGSLSSGVATKAHIEVLGVKDGTLSGEMRLQDPTAFSTAALNTSDAFGVVALEMLASAVGVTPPVAPTDASVEG